MNQHTVTQGYRRYALTLLLAVNLLNYVDRQVLYAIFPLIKGELSLTDTQLGLLGSAFMLCYMVSAPFFGWIGDRASRTRLASSGAVVWSLATAISGVATGYPALLAARTTVGVGEASFGTVSPGLVADFFPTERRGRVLAWFYLAIPVGSALGYILGGQLGQRFGWHAAFLMVGVPGLLLALPLWTLREPPRGGDAVPPRPGQVEPAPGYGSLRRNRSFVLNTLAMAAMTFALGGLAQWLPSFLNRVHGLDVARGNTLFGAVTVVAGIAGTLTGGWLGDRLQRKNARGYLLVSGWGFLVGAPVAVWAIVAPTVASCMGAIFLAEFFLFLNTGPLNTVIINVTRPDVRAMAFAINIFFIHALGDAISPTIIGWCSDLWGLRAAILITPCTMALAGAFCFLCMRSIASDMADAAGTSL